MRLKALFPAVLALSLLAARAFADDPVTMAQVTPDPRYKGPGLAARWPHIGLDEARRLQALPGVIFVDGRSYGEWEASHIPGALPLPVGEFDNRYAQYRDRLVKAAVLVSYCHGEGCSLSETLAELLGDKGHQNVAVFPGGYPAWLAAGLPLEDKNGKAVATRKASKPRRRPKPKPVPTPVQ